MSNNNNVAVHSPLNKIKRTLKVSRFLLGFPLKVICSNSVTCARLEFTTSIECIRLAILCIILSLEPTFSLTLQITNADIWDQLEISRADTIFTNLLMPLYSVVAYVTYLKLYHNNVDSINSLCKRVVVCRRKLEEIKSLKQEHVSKIKKMHYGHFSTQSLKKTFYECFIASVAILAMLYAHHCKYLDNKNEARAKMFQGHHHNEDQTYFIISFLVFMFLKSILAYLFCNQPIASSTHLLINHLLVEVGEDFEEWCRALKYFNSYPNNSRTRRRNLHSPYDSSKYVNASCHMISSPR